MERIPEKITGKCKADHDTKDKAEKLRKTMDPAIQPGRDKGH